MTMKGLDLEDMWNSTSPPMSLLPLHGDDTQRNASFLSTNFKSQDKEDEFYLGPSFAPFTGSSRAGSDYVNMSNGTNGTSTDVPAADYNWGVLSLSMLIVATMVGNVLVCLAVCWEKRLQNMTNYFLMSLAIADLLVSVLVMPLGMVVELYGYFPLNSGVCVMWATFDVLMCTASIWHMCTMSMDRYFTLKYPMKYGRNKTRTMVVLKILFVWIVSIAICCPVCILGFIDYSHVYNNGACVPTIRSFILYGSLFAFYVPLCIMVVTYVLTIKILCDNQTLMKSIAKQQGDRKGKRDREGSYSTSYLTPHVYLPRFMDRPSIDTTASGLTSYNETSIVHDTVSSPKEEHLNLALPLVNTRQSPWEEGAAVVKSDGPPPAWESHNGSLLVPTQITNFWDSTQNANTVPESAVSFQAEPLSAAGMTANGLGCAVSSNGCTGNTNQAFMGNSNKGFVEHAGNGFAATTGTNCFSDIPSKNYFSMSTSQPHLPSALSQPTSPMIPRQRLTSAPPNALSHLTGDMKPQLLFPAHHRSADRLSSRSKTSINQDDSLLSAASSLNSMLSRNTWGSTAFSEFDDPELMEKLSMIEQEMDECLQESTGHLAGDGAKEQREGKDLEEEMEAENNGVDDDDEEDGDDDDEEEEEEEGGEDDVQSETDERKASMEQLCKREGPSSPPPGGAVRTLVSIPPVLVSSPPVTSSDDTLDDTDSEKSDLITIHLKASGCYMYQIEPSQSGSLLPCLTTKVPQPSRQAPTAALLKIPDSADCSADELDRDQDLELFSHVDTEDSASESISGHSRIMVHQFPPKKKKKSNSRLRKYTTGWKSLMQRRKSRRKETPICKINGMLPANIISKRTASNEKKASKVLGIIFAVFVILWTPFFMVNILSVACEPCMDALTPAMMASIVWLGYMSSLANPIIYTMFNTAFRRAFYRILTCKFPRPTNRKVPDTIGMTNASNWGSDRRNTLTLTLKEY